MQALEQFKTDLNTILTKMDAINDRIVAGDASAVTEKGDLQVKFDRMEKRLSDIEIKADRVAQVAADTPSLGGGIGDVLVSSKSYKTFAGGNAFKMAEPVHVKGAIDSVRNRGIGAFLATKNDTEHGTEAPTSVVPMVPTHIVPGFVSVPTRPRSLLDLMPSMPTSAGTIEYVQEDGFYALATTLNGALAPAAVSAVVEDIEGFFADVNIPQVVTLSYGLAAEEDVLVLTVTPATNTITFAACANAHANGAEVIAEDFDFVAELTLRPLGTVKFTDKSVTARILGIGIAISKQLAKDAPALAAYLNRRLPRQIEVELERWMLYGNGSTQIQGLLTHADVQTLAGSGDEYDDIRIAMTLVDLAFFPTTGVVMHPTDLQAIDLNKDTTNQYIQYRTAGMAWDVPVVKSAVIEVKHALIGAFDIAATLWEADAMSVAIYDQHSDWALRGKLLVLAEVRVAQSVERPKSLVHITFA